MLEWEMLEWEMLEWEMRQEVRGSSEATEQSLLIYASDLYLYFR
jgi:hypothetical protein